MWKFRPGFAAWLLFALACLVPGWFLREPLAAETQMQCEFHNRTPPIGREKWRALWPGGMEYLVGVLRDSTITMRRAKAAYLLHRYDDPIACAARMEGSVDPNPSVRGNSIGPIWDQTPGVIAGAFDALGEERLLGIFRRVQPCVRQTLIRLLWVTRPAMGERVLSRILRETRDPMLGADVARWCDYTVFEGSMAPGCGEASPETFERRMRTLRAGLGNPDTAIRFLCEEVLDREYGVMHALGRRGR